MGKVVPELHELSYNQWMRTRTGATSTEYALLVALIAMAGIAAMSGLGGSLSGVFWSILDGTGGFRFAGEYSDGWGHHSVSRYSWVMGGGYRNVTITQASSAEGWMVGQDENGWSHFDWTEQGGTKYYCESAYWLSSEQEALDATRADPSNPSQSGCGPFAWSAMTPD